MNKLIREIWIEEPRRSLSKKAFNLYMEELKETSAYYISKGGLMPGISVEYRHVDGWHVFTSGDIHGLYVASPDPELAFNDVAQSIQKLLKLNEGLECNIIQELSLEKFLEK